MDYITCLIAQAFVWFMYYLGYRRGKRVWYDKGFTDGFNKGNEYHNKKA
jgi:hypothetical protein